MRITSGGVGVDVLPHSEEKNRNKTGRKSCCKTHTGLYTTTQYRLLKLRVDIWQYREVEGKKVEIMWLLISATCKPQSKGGIYLKECLR